MLILAHPKLVARDCRHCLKFMYDETKGEPVLFRGQPMPRRENTPPPCRTEKGCPKGTPEESRELTRQNRQAYDHYLQCKAVGRWPEDSIVIQNAAIVRSIEDAVEERDRKIAAERMSECLSIFSLLPKLLCR